LIGAITPTCGTSPAYSWFNRTIVMATRPEAPSSKQKGRSCAKQSSVLRRQNSTHVLAMLRSAATSHCRANYSAGSSKPSACQHPLPPINRVGPATSRTRACQRPLASHRHSNEKRHVGVNNESDPRSASSVGDALLDTYRHENRNGNNCPDDQKVTPSRFGNRFQSIAKCERDDPGLTSYWEGVGRVSQTSSLNTSG